MHKNVQVQSLLLLTSMGRLFHIFYHKNKILYFLTQKRKCLKCLKNCACSIRLVTGCTFVSNQKTPFWKLGGLCSVKANTHKQERAAQLLLLILGS